MSEKRIGVDAHTPPEVAGGIPAGISLTRHVLDHMGLLMGARTLLEINQADGFDCPGCAWPDPKERSRLEFCENGVKAVADEATRRRVTPGFFQEHSVEELATWPDHELNRAGRITHPMILEPGGTHYQPITWDEAFARIGAELNSLHHPDEAIFYTSGRTSNEAAFLYQLFVRQLGTNNLPDCSNMCHESSGTGMGEAVGVGKGSVTLEDFNEAGAIFIFGQNPGTNHPRMLSALQEAKRGGCTIVSINPLREPALVRFKHPKEVSGTIGRGTAISDLYLQVKVNGDVAVLKGMMKMMLEVERALPGTVLDQGFIDEHTTGFEQLAADLEATSWEEIEQASGLKRREIEAAARVAIDHERYIVCWAMGITQHVNGVANVQSLVNLCLLRGALGKPGAGLCPVRGHSNVQGDRTMGIWERPSEALLNRLAERFDFAPPREHGHDVVHAIGAMHRGEGKVFFAMGGNFLSATPDTDFTAEALGRTRMTVQVSTKLNRAHLVHGETALILPCLGRTERDEQAGGKQFVTVEDSMGVVHRSRGNLRPASPALLSEPDIVARLATATLGERSSVEWMSLVEDYDRIRDHIEATIPGFEDYNRRVREPAGFTLPHPIRDSRTFNTSDGKAHFTVHAIPTHELPAGGLLMFTVRSHDQYNTTIYSLDDRYRGVRGERRVVFLHPDDMSAHGLAKGDRVRLESHFEGTVRKAPGFVAVPFDVPRGCAATYFPEANVLVPVGQFARGSHTPASKSVVITLHPEP